MSEPIKYFINKEKGIIVAVLEDCKDDFDYYMLTKDPAFSVCEKPIPMREKYVGKAKCCSSDNFDEEYGKELARTRLLLKYYEDFTKCFYRYKESRIKRVMELSRKPLVHYAHLVNRMIELEKNF